MAKKINIGYHGLATYQTTSGKCGEASLDSYTHRKAAQRSTQDPAVLV